MRKKMKSIRNNRYGVGQEAEHQLHDKQEKNSNNGNPPGKKAMLDTHILIVCIVKVFYKNAGQSTIYPIENAHFILSFLKLKPVADP
jgi:hypothetical protein